MKTILIIGGSGLVGSRFIELSKRSPYRLITPSHIELDTLDKKHLEKTVRKITSWAVVNFSTIIKTDETEKERGNKNGIAWQTNVVGTSNLVAACKETDSFFIHISTDAVFPGTEDCPGPYHETSLPASSGKGINWYGYTKLVAEQEVKKLGTRGVIIRISHPFGSPHSEKDLIKKTMHDIHAGHKLFTDQQFTPTFIDDLVRSVWIIADKEISGTFHVACRGITTRYAFALYIAKKMHIRKQIVPGSLRQFLAKSEHAIRPLLGGLDTTYTERTLGLRFHAWKDAADTFIKRTKFSK